MSPQLFGFGLMFYTKGAEKVRVQLNKINGAFTKMKVKAKAVGVTISTWWKKAGLETQVLQARMAALQARMVTLTATIRSGLMRALSGLFMLIGLFAFPIAKTKEYGLYLEKLVFVAQRGSQDMSKFRKEISAFALEMGILTEFSPTEVVKGLYEIASAGYSTVEDLKAMFPAMKQFSTMTGGMMDMGKAGEMIVAVLGKFQLEASESTRIVDQFAGVVKRTLFHMEKLPIFIRSLKAAPLVFGSQLSEMLALGGVLRQIGLLPAQAGMTIANIAGRVTILARYAERLKSKKSPPVKGSPMYYVKELGLTMENLKKQGTGTFKPILDILEMISVRANKTFKQAAERQVAYTSLLNRMGLQAILAAENIEYAGEKGFTAVRKLMGELETIKRGLAEEFGQKVLDTLWGQFQLLKGSVEALGLMLGNVSEGPLRVFLDGLYEWLNKMINLVSVYPEVGQLIVIFMALIPALLIVTGLVKMLYAGVGILVVGILKLTVVKGLLLAVTAASNLALAWEYLKVFGLYQVMRMLTLQIWAAVVAKSILLIEITAIIAAVALLLWGIWELGKRWKWLGDIVGGFFGGVSAGLKWVAEKLTKGFGALFGIDVKDFKDMADAWTAPTGKTKEFLDAQKNLIKYEMDPKLSAALNLLGSEGGLAEAIGDNTDALTKNISTRDQYTLDLRNRIDLMRSMSGLWGDGSASPSSARAAPSAPMRGVGVVPYSEHGYASPYSMVKIEHATFTIHGASMMAPEDARELIEDAVKSMSLEASRTERRTELDRK